MNTPLYGLVAEFKDHKALLAAAHRAREEGYRQMDGYSPFPIEGLAEALGRAPTRVPLLVLLGGIFGGLGGYFMQWYANVISYPLNIAGRPLNSWPMFVPIAFELTILCAALSAFISALLLNKLPQPYHPIFNAPNFVRASTDRFFLCIEATDRSFDPAGTRAFLTGLQPIAVSEVIR